ncbi:hypothetical protein AB0F81_35465 [Actinoplanes sp. NPDC024001]|uniref:hypothetical protein n=1 Tax=Actinoplanes sp. NPDC024001 TaxID=3154598 RepID=UPI0033F70CEC
MDGSRELRWSMGLFLVFAAFVPMLIVSLDNSGAWAPVLLAAPINVIGAVLAVVGMGTPDPRASAHRLWLAAAVVLIGNGALYAVR